MPQITVKKMADELIYYKKTVMHTYNVAGKVIKVYEHNEEGKDITEYDVKVDETDLEQLTELEQEVFSTRLDEVIAITNGEEVEFDYDIPETVDNPVEEVQNI